MVEDTTTAQGSHVQRRDRQHDQGRGKRRAYMVASGDGVDEGWYDVDDGGSLRADDECYSCLREDPEVERAEQHIAEAAHEVKQAQERLENLMSRYDESEESQSAVRGQSTG